MVDWKLPWTARCAGCAAEALPWATTPAVHRFPNIPDPSVFGPIVAEFAARGPHP